MKDVENAGTPWEEVKIEAKKRRGHNLQIEDISQIKPNKKRNILEWAKKRS